MKNINIPPDWETFADRIIQDTQTRICIVIGNTDSGKSTLCKYLIHKWTASGKHIGYVDSDLGQSTLGPPTTVSVKIFDKPPDQDDYSGPTGLQFVGNNTPEGFLLQTIQAIKKMVDKSHLSGSEITLVDTTGFTDGPVARILKLQKIEMLRPQWIIGLQAEDEMEHLLKGYEKMGWQVARLTRSKQAVMRSQTERQKYRAEKYKAYFRTAKIANIFIRNIVLPSCIIGTGDRIPANKLTGDAFSHDINHLYMEKCGHELLIIANHPDESIHLHKLKDYTGISSIVFIAISDLKDLLVGLNDSDRHTLGLGTIIDFDPFAGRLTLFTPVQDVHKITALHLGTIKLEHGEKECGKVRIIRYM